MFDLNYLYNFILVAEHQSFTRASAQSGIPLSTISRRIDKFEINLDIKLIHRSTKSFSLTAEGKALFQATQSDLNSVISNTLLLKNKTLSPDRLIRITAPVFFGSTELPILLKKYKDLNPLANFEVILDDSQLDLEKENIDVSFRIGSLKDSDLICRKISEPQLQLCCHPALKKKINSIKCLEKEQTTILLHSSAPQSISLLNTKDKSSLAIAAKNIVRCNNYQFIFEAIQSAMGVSYLPQKFIQSKQRGGLIVALFPEYIVNHKKTIYIVYPRFKGVSAIKNFIDFVIEQK